MMDTVHIQNFKSIRELELELGAINVLLGAKGAGKTNFIQFFELLRVLRNDELERYVAQRGWADAFLHHGRKRSDYLSGSISFRGIAEEHASKLYQVRLVPDPHNKLFIERESTGSREEAQDAWDLFSASPESYASYILSEQNVYTRNQSLRDHFSSFQRYHFHDIRQTATLQIPFDLVNDRYLKPDGSNLAAFLYWMQEASPKRFSLLEYTLQSVLPFFGGFSLKPDRLDRGTLQLKWQDAKARQPHSAQHLSDGSLRFIALATLFLQPDPPETIIVEEPELGLHPKAVGKLAGLIRRVSLQSQIILSTQSVLLVSCFEPADLITVDRQQEQSVFRRLDAQELAAWLEDYSFLGDFE